MEIHRHPNGVSSAKFWGSTVETWDAFRSDAEFKRRLKLSTPMNLTRHSHQFPVILLRMSTESLTQRWLRQNVSSYAQKDRVLLDFDTALARFTTLRPKSDVYSSVTIRLHIQSHKLIFLLQLTMMVAPNFYYVYMASCRYLFAALHIISQSLFGSPKSTPVSPQ
jgi:hypothetical protein